MKRKAFDPATASGWDLWTTEQLLEAIEKDQDIQRHNPPSSDDWCAASVRLKSAFAEMARRTNP